MAAFYSTFKRQSGLLDIPLHPDRARRTLECAATFGGALRNDDIGVQVLRRAAEVVGGNSALANRLHVSPPKLQDWLHRREPIPWQISLIATEIVVPALLAEFRKRSLSG